MKSAFLRPINRLLEALGFSSRAAAKLIDLGGSKELVQQGCRAATARRYRVVIIAWDMSHNAAGRAYMLADMLSRDHDVLLVGPLFRRFGATVWRPLNSAEIHHRVFQAESLKDFAKEAAPFVRNLNADVVIACKPRLPSIILALLLKHRLGCPIILDVDDHELSFFSNTSSLSLSDARLTFEGNREAADQPYGEVWTRLAETFVSSFDAQTVSNVSLQRRFGGTIVKHARDELLFHRDPSSRARIREEFGYSHNKVVLFLGTPRGHKGIFRIADALRRLGKTGFALCIVGTIRAKDVSDRLRSYSDIRIDLFPDQPWARLPELIQLADCVCLLQDETSPIAQYQLPAKLTDALASEVPVAVTDVPPFADIPPGLVTVVQNDEDLDRFLAKVLDGSAGQDTAKHGRAYFDVELSYATNRERLANTISQALENKGGWRDEWTELLQLVSDLSGSILPAAADGGTSQY